MPISDIRQKVLSGSIKLVKEALWVDRWEEWVEVRELRGDERSAFMQANTNKKTGQMNITNFYPHLALLSVRYPSVDCEPADVDVPVLDPVTGEPVLDADGKPTTVLGPPPHIERFPTLEERQNNPDAGKLIFAVTDRDAINQGSGAALEQIAQVAARISALLPQDVFEKKDS